MESLRKLSLPWAGMEDQPLPHLIYGKFSIQLTYLGMETHFKSSPSDLVAIS